MSSQNYTTYSAAQMTSSVRARFVICINLYAFTMCSYAITKYDYIGYHVNAQQAWHSKYRNVIN